MAVNNQNIREMGLKHLWTSPNTTIKNHLDGVTFKEAIKFNSVPQLIPNWKYPILIAEHSHADVFECAD